MPKSIFRGLTMVLLFIPRLTLAQHAELDLPQQRLLLEMASAFVIGEKEFTINFDSGLVEASRYNGVNRIILIGEGFYDKTDKIKNEWPDERNISILKQYLPSLSAIETTRHLALIGAFYSFRPGGDKKDLDSAINYLTKAKGNALESKDPNLASHVSILLGKSYLKKYQYDSAANYFTQAITNSSKSGDRSTEAQAWFYWGLYHPFDFKSYDERIGYFEKALAIYQTLNDLEKQAACEFYIGGLRFFTGKFDKSVEGFSRSLRITQKMNFPFTHYPDIFLALVWQQLGNEEQGMKSAINALKSAEAKKDSLAYGNIYLRIGFFYALDTLKPTEQMIWLRKALIEFKKFRNPNIYRTANQMVVYLNAHHQSQEALNILLDIEKNYPPPNPVWMEDISISFANTYAHLGKYEQAEKYFLLAENLEKKAELIRGNMYKYLLYLNIGDYYLSRQQYEKSRKYINQVMIYLPAAKNPEMNAYALGLLYKIDSATGHYLSAMRFYQQSRRIRDSILNTTVHLKVEEMSARYNTEKKDDDIKLLTQQDLLKETQLKQSRTNARIMIGSAIVLALLCGLLYNRYRLKQRSNRQLEIQQEEINQKNSKLLRLVNEKDLLLEEKDLLLEEKEWLVKEIHHRVKNNLQIVISLLNTQSRFLDSEEAVRAIDESRHRMQAMSLIHQKLYQSENVAFVNMQTYVSELTEYLEASFNTGKEIFYELMIDPIELDISQAIPIGLILNEAITNAIKYAFIKKDAGIITIDLKIKNNNQASLEIRDNGEGLTEAFDASGSSTMGMRLIRGLVKQIGGKMLVVNEHGLCIKIDFNIDNNLKIITAKELLKEAANFS